MEKQAYSIRKGIEDIEVAIDFMSEAYHGLMEIYSEYSHGFLFADLDDAMLKCEGVRDWLKQHQWRAASDSETPIRRAE